MPQPSMGFQPRKESHEQTQRTEGHSGRGTALKGLMGQQSWQQEHTENTDFILPKGTGPFEYHCSNTTQRPSKEIQAQ